VRNDFDQVYRRKAFINHFADQKLFEDGLEEFEDAR
jgi:hypothetical protein